jgi:hypothetical protein
VVRSELSPCRGLAGSQPRCAASRPRR